MRKRRHAVVLHNILGNVKCIFARSSAGTVGYAHVGRLELRNLTGCLLNTFKGSVRFGRKNLKR